MCGDYESISGHRVPYCPKLSLGDDLYQGRRSRWGMSSSLTEDGREVWWPWAQSVDVASREGIAEAEFWTVTAFQSDMARRVRKRKFCASAKLLN